MIQKKLTFFNFSERKIKSSYAIWTEELTSILYIYHVNLST